MGLFYVMDAEGHCVKTVGDPHLGKQFVHGVPLERRGEREKHQRETFLKELMEVNHPENGDLNTVAVVVIGDLFDGFRIENEVLNQTYDMVVHAATSNPLVDYIILMGNHDVSRNVGLVSSFDILRKMVKLENVHFITEVQDFHLKNVKGPILLCPYSAFKTTGELFGDNAKAVGGTYNAAFGHWDTTSFGDDHNLLPYEYLSKVTRLVVNGHEHNGREFMYGPTLISVTGSMLPYSHAEDNEETIYVTRTLSQYLENPQAFSDKCLRLILKPGEEVPDNIDALAVTFKYLTVDNTQENKVVMEDFSMKTIFEQVFTENGLSNTVTKKYWDKYQERDSDAASA